jgi:phosphate:Na+ symporter
MSVANVFSILGGLGMFLYGMKLMSDGLEKVAGAKLRKVLEFFTKNRFIGMLVGIFFTAIVQSSSATTVMVVSFVNSGLMNLFQAAGVILGANIGTTVTSQLIAFNLSEVAPLFLMAGVIMVMFGKKDYVEKIGEVVLGFGILFVGMSTMSGAMSSLKESPEIVSSLAKLDNPFVALLVGFFITAILQSSSATVGIVLVMASQGLLILPICFYIILGCNMGSCVSALIASLGGKKDAKRAAWIHFLCNVIGSAVIVVLLAVCGDWIERFINGISGGSGIEAAARNVANAHTLFKVFQVAICFPITGAIVKLTYFIVPGTDKGTEEFSLLYVGDHTVFSPSTAYPSMVQELQRMGRMAVDNLSRSMDALITCDKDLVENVKKVEKNINFMNHEITKYLVKLTQADIPMEDARKLGGLFHVVNDIERIGDHAENVAEFAETRLRDGISFSKQGEEELKHMMSMVIRLVNYSIEMFYQNSKEHLQEILELEDSIDKEEKRLQRTHIIRLTSNQCTPQAGMIFSDLVSNLERVADHGTNIAFSILKENPEEE